MLIAAEADVQMTAVAQAFARMTAAKAECELCDMDLSYCEHGLLSRWANLETRGRGNNWATAGDCRPPEASALI